MLRSSHDACGRSTQTTSTINLKRSTLHPHEGQADRPNTPSDSVNLGSNPGPPAKHLPDMTVYFQFPWSGGSCQAQGSHFHAVLDSLQRRSVYLWRKKPW